MEFCLTRLLEYYKDKVDPKRLEAIHDEIQSMHDQGMSQRQVMEKIKLISDQVSVAAYYDLTREALHAQKVEDLLAVITHPRYEGRLNDSIEEMLFATVRADKGVGNSIQNLKYVYNNKLVKTLDMAILSRDGGPLLQNMQGFDIDQWTGVLAKMHDPKLKTDPVTEFLAQVFQHQNDVFFGEKSRIGVPDIYNPKYGFKIAYDGSAIKQAGLRKVMLDLLQSVDFKSIENVDPAKLAKTITYLKDPAITEGNIRKLLAKNDTGDYAYALMKSASKSFDSWLPENGIYSTEIYDTYSGVKKGFSVFNERQWTFKSAPHQMNFLADYGRHGTNIYKYIKEDGRQLATSLSFLDKFGPQAEEAFEAVVKFNEARSMRNKIPFDAAKARSQFDFAAGRITRIPEEFAGAQIGNRNLPSIPQVTRAITNMSSASVLAGSGITQVFLDPANVASHYLFKSSENFAQQLGPFVGQYALSLKDALATAPLFKKFMDTPKHFMEVADIAERTLGEVGMLERLAGTDSWTVANAVTTVSGAQFFNRVSSIFSYRLLNHMVKNNFIDNADVVLGRYGMSPKDLDFLQNAITLSDSPARIDLLPDVIFENNPLKMRPNLYKRNMAKALGMYLEENRRQFAPQIDDKTRYNFTTFNNDDQHPISIIAKMFMHLKLMGIKVLQDGRQLYNQEAGEGMVNRALTGAKITAGFTAFLGIGGFALNYTKDYMGHLIGEGGDVLKANEKTMNEYMKRDRDSKHPRWVNQLISGLTRYGVASPLIEPFMGAKDAKDAVLSTIATPALKATLYPTLSVGSAISNYIMGKQPVTRDNSRTFIDGIKMLTPGQSVIRLTPWEDDYYKQQQKWSKELMKFNRMLK